MAEEVTLAGWEAGVTEPLEDTVGSVDSEDIRAGSVCRSTEVSDLVGHS